MTFFYDTILNRDDEEIPIRVKVRKWPGRAAVYPSLRDDTGSPADPESVEILKAWDDCGGRIELTEDEMCEVEQEILEEDSAYI